LLLLLLYSLSHLRYQQGLDGVVAVAACAFSLGSARQFHGREQGRRAQGGILTPESIGVRGLSGGPVQGRSESASKVSVERKVVSGVVVIVVG